MQNIKRKESFFVFANMSYDGDRNGGRARSRSRDRDGGGGVGGGGGAPAGGEEDGKLFV